MERKVKVVQYGVGKMSLYTMRYVYEKGGEIVGAIDINPKVLEETRPDIVIVTTMSLIKDLENPLMLCAELGLNAITTCEEAFYPENSNHFFKLFPLDTRKTICGISTPR